MKRLTINQKYPRNGIKIFLISLLMPGLGYLRIGELRMFVNAVVAFYGILIVGACLNLYPYFSGFISLLLLTLFVHLGSGFHAAMMRKIIGRPRVNRFLMAVLTVIFILLTGTSFSNSRTLMGFDRVSMAVPVMEPSIRKGEQLLVDTWIYKREKPRSGDIVVHSFPGQSGLYINRIVAVGGDVIEIKDGKILVNGRVRKEEYVNAKSDTSCVSREMGSLRIPLNHYFVMGDNRDRSLGDSRFSGTINLTNINGRVTYILYSSEIARVGTKFDRCL